MRLERMPQGNPGMNAIAVAAAVAGTLQNASLLQFSHYPQHGTLGYPDPLGDVAHGQILIRSDTDQYMGMVTEEGPTDLTRVIRRHLYAPA